MNVVDCSAIVDLLVGEASSPVMRLLEEREQLAVPSLIDYEVLSALRGLELGKRITAAEANEARKIFEGISLYRYDFSLLKERVWTLRHQYTTYDASYIALAEVLEAPLYTCDATLNAGAHTAVVVLIS